MKCIGNKCSKYFHSDYYHWCYIINTNIKPGEECSINNIINKLEDDLNTTEVLKGQILKNQEK